MKNLLLILILIPLCVFGQNNKSETKTKYVDFNDPNVVRFNGSIFRIQPGIYTFESAKAKALKLGGQIACIKDDKTSKAIAKLFKNNNGDVLLGGYKTMGKWKWVDGTDIEYTNFAPSTFREVDVIYIFIGADSKGKWVSRKGISKIDQKFGGFLFEMTKEQMIARGKTIRYPEDTKQMFMRADGSLVSIKDVTPEMRKEDLKEYAKRKAQSKADKQTN